MSEAQDESKTDEGQSRLTVGLERNFRVQERFDALMREGKHGFYETIFAVVREEVEQEREACANELEELGGKAMRQAADMLRSNVKVSCLPQPTED